MANDGVFEVGIPEAVRAGAHVKLHLVGYMDPRMGEQRCRFQVMHGPPGLNTTYNPSEAESLVTILYEQQSPYLDDHHFPGVDDGTWTVGSGQPVGGIMHPTTYDVDEIIPYEGAPEGVQNVFDWTTTELAMNTVPGAHSLYIENSSQGGGVGSNIVLRGLWWIYEGSVPLSNIVVGARASRGHFAG